MKASLGATSSRRITERSRVNDGSRQVTIPMAQAIIRSLALAAAKVRPAPRPLY
jgi:hypothetical protein